MSLRPPSNSHNLYKCKKYLTKALVDNITEDMNQSDADTRCFSNAEIL